VQVQNLQAVELISPLFVAPRRMAPNNKPKVAESVFEATMEGLHMLPLVLQKGMHMVKIDLKDAYLTVPVAKKCHPLLAF